MRTGLISQMRKTVSGILIGRIVKMTSRVISRSDAQPRIHPGGWAMMRGGMIDGITTPVNDFRIAQARGVMRGMAQPAKTSKTAYSRYGRAKLLLSRFRSAAATHREFEDMLSDFTLH